MKKNLFALMMISSGIAYSGTMSPVAQTSLQPFVSVEGGYSWNTLDGIHVGIVDVGSIYTLHHEHGGTGRVAVGLLNPMSSTFITSAEIGWGYYGHVTMNPVAVGPFTLSPGFPNLSAINLKSTLNGFDVLAGVIYNQPKFDVFFKAGALLQNSVTKLDINFAELSPDLSGLADAKINRTQALPEIKLGASYHLLNNLSIMASWSHAFGVNRKIDILINPNLPIGQIDINLQNPTLNVALVGLQYQFNS